MKLIGENGLSLALSRWSVTEPRVVAAGNFATPSTLLVDKVLPQYRLFMLNAQPTLPDRVGVTYETPFVGPGMRGARRLEYLPARLSLVPRLFATTRPPDILLLHTSTPPRRQGLVGRRGEHPARGARGCTATRELVTAQVSNPQECRTPRRCRNSTSTRSIWPSRWFPLSNTTSGRSTRCRCRSRIR